MKRTIAFLLILACCVSLMGCGEKEKAENPTTASTGTPTQAPTKPSAAAELGLVDPNTQFFVPDN